MTTETISDTIKILHLDNGDEITLVGTAHVSHNSVEEVERMMDEMQPDMVCLELDSARFKSKTDESGYKTMDLKKIFKEGKTFLVLANTALASFQKKMGAQTGSAPGEEILTAGRIAKEKGIPFTLCDRDITVTFKRAWAKSGGANRLKLIAALLSSAFDKEEYKPEQLEELKKEDTLESMMNELAKELPGAKEALIDERDRYLATSIFKAEGHKKLAVIGAGHASGIIKTIEKLEKKEMSEDLTEISQVPPKKKTGNLIGWLVPLAIVGYIVYCCLTYSFQEGMTKFAVWAACNGACSMLLAILSNAHPLNWLVSLVTAPISVMSPVLGVGVFTGIAESELRKPSVKDVESISDDIGKFKGWFRNRVLHAFLIFFTTSLGSILGTFVVTPIVWGLL